MQKHDTTLIHRIQVLLQTLEIQSNRFLVIVRVSLDFETRILENWNVITPSWGGEVDRLCVGIVTSEESSGDTKSTSSRKGLSDCDLRITESKVNQSRQKSERWADVGTHTSFLERFRAFTVSESSSGVGESVQTSNR